MSLELVSRLMRGARHVPPGVHPAARAYGLVPELVGGLPEVDPGPGERPVRLPVACTGVIQGMTERAVRAAVDEALAELRPPTAAELANRLQTDALTQALRRLILEGLSVSPGGGAMAALELVRLTARALAAPGPLLQEPVRALQALPAERRGLALRRVAAPMQARLAAACFDLARAGVPCPPLLSRLAASPLVWVFERGALPVDLPLLGALLAVPVPGAQLEAATRAFDAVAAGLLDRVGNRRATGDDLAFSLRFCIPELVAAGEEAARAQLRAEPDAWTILLPQLARWVDADALVEAGVPDETAAALLRPEVGVGLAATVQDVFRAAAEWDVLSLLVGALVPAPEGSVERRFLVPRGAPATGTVVAVAIGGPRVAVAEPVALASEVDQAVVGWGAAVRDQAIWSSGSEVACFAFADPAAALRFALAFRRRPAAGLPVPAVSVATGDVNGGTDGGVSRFGGPAVLGALRRLPHASHAEELPSVLTPVGLEAGVLVGEGVAVDESTVAVLRALPRAKRSGPRPPGVTDAWEDEGHIVALVPIVGVPGAFNASEHTLADWEALAGAAPAERTDDARSPVSAPGVAAAPSSVPVPVTGAAAPPTPAEAPPPPPPPPPPPVEAAPAAEAGSGELPAFEAEPPISNYETRRPRRAPAPEPPAPAVGAPADAPAVSAAPAPPAARPPLPPGGDVFLHALGTPVAASTGGANPFDEPAPAAPEAPASGGGFGPSTDFSDVFGVPVGDRDAPPPTAPPPAFFQGIGEFAHVEDVGDSPSKAPGRLDVQNEGFSVPMFGGGPTAGTPASTTSSPRLRRAPAVDFGFILNGYAVFVERERVVFGRPYGTRLIDLHAYDTGANLDRAYQLFVEAKIREGFIPQTELTGDLPRGVTVMPLDLERLKAAWAAVT